MRSMKNFLLFLIPLNKIGNPQGKFSALTQDLNFLTHFQLTSQ